MQNVIDAANRLLILKLEIAMRENEKMTDRNFVTGTQNVLGLKYSFSYIVQTGEYVCSFSVEHQVS